MKKMINLEAVNGGGFPGCNRWSMMEIIDAINNGSTLTFTQLAAIYCNG